MCRTGLSQHRDQSQVTSGQHFRFAVFSRCAIHMAFLRANDKNLRLKIKEIDLDIQNKFSVRWFEEKSKDGVPFRCWLAKKKECGVAWCLRSDRCFATLQYKRGGGKKVLHQHANTKIHQKNMKVYATSEWLFLRRFGFNIFARYGRKFHSILFIFSL